MNMKKYLAAAIIGALSIGAIGSATAQTVTWVQNANFALTAQVQVSDGVVKKFAINSKTLIQYLKGSTNTGVGNIETITTNGFAVVTNSPFLPTNSNPADFPHLFTDYSVTVGSSHFTNDIHFTNDFTETALEPPDPATYELTNIVSLDPSVTGFGTNVDVVIFTNLPNATNIMAVHDNTVSNATVFTLIDFTRTITPGLVTNGVPPEFISKNPKLIVKSAPDSQIFSWFIRDGTPKAPIDYDVTTFFNYGPIAPEVSQTKGTGFADFIDLTIDFNLDPASSGIGTTFGMEANGRQTRTTVPQQAGLFVKGPTATCVGSGTAAPPNSTFTGVKPLPTGAMVINGKFSAGGGKIETAP